MFTTTFDRIPFTVFAPDSGAGTGGAAGDSGQDPGPGTPQGGEPDPTSQEDPEPKPTDAETLKARLEALEKDLKETRSEAASYRTKLRSLEEQKTKDEQDQLKEQGKYKTLAEQLEAQVKDLEPKAAALEAQVKAYEERETQRLASLVKDWPENLRQVVEKAATLDEKQAIVEGLLPTVEALNAASKVSGGSPTPKPAGSSNDKITPSRPVRL